ncbi:hypothetical protein VOLCADRAFT_93670 [Volvox carteri f. nagariensis]|uniref:Acyltransferase n=1 Tax=Volvox carteri f. nagariensis TaxID=3068 RepID=D8U2Q8_VOLCA|nr:uncharacterized protein VOLCADRAFT_93670 [Volvox carteri f. nagariensis]EFJ45849.1 hypothetical protein VOLCADRAFT_93670 [Volvox carteri f. nagariensis]|eukprot:XP_002952927.1 hypothetical protein VOLCADRAFT_93670 [Volvox carteri f. nagariensis]
MGGHRHAVFQVFAWGLWTLSAAITLPVYLSLLVDDSRSSAACSMLLSFLGLRKPLIPLTHVDAASGAAAVSGLWGELFMLKALLVFESDTRLSSGGRKDDSRRKATKGRQQQQQQIECCKKASDGSEKHANGIAIDQHGEGRNHRTQLLEGPLASLLVCLMGMALSVTGFGLLLALEHLPDTSSGVLYCCLALSCVFIGASSTHGLGGYLRHCAGAASSAGAAVLRGGASAAAAAAATVAAGAMHGASGVGGASAAKEEEEEADVATTWRFFQPFQGGSVFVATQAIGWTLFSSTVVAVLLLAKELVVGVGYCLRCWALAVGALMMATQLVLGVSILTYENRSRARNLLQPVLHHPRASFARAAGLIMPVVLMYLPLHVSCSSMASVFTLLPPRHAAAVVLAVLVPYFVITLRGHPAHSGCRRWEWLCRWFAREVEGSLSWWAGRLEVIRDFPGTAHQVADELDDRRHREQQQQQQQQKQEEQHCEQQHAQQQLQQHSKTQEERSRGLRQGRFQEQNSVSLLPCSGAAGSRHQADLPRGCHRRYVLGFHPHGLYPTGAGFLPLMPTVQAAFPGLTLVTLTASIVHYLPGLRDIAGWAGFRQVTRATFRRALRDTGAVLLCPGGQAELVYADRAFPPRGSPAAAAAAAFAAGAATATAAALTPTPQQPEEGSPLDRAILVIFAGHQGFVRLALEEGAWLVPVLALGETLQLRNLISAPEMQRITYKRLGFPVPFILGGRWSLTTLPLRNPLVYVIGRPLQPPPLGLEVERCRKMAPACRDTAPSSSPPGGDGNGGRGKPELRQRRHRRQAPPVHAGEAGGGGDGDVSSGVVTIPQSVVDEYHCRFYAALAALWRRYHSRHPVLRHAELLLEWGRHGRPAEFERYLAEAEREQTARAEADGVVTAVF